MGDVSVIARRLSAKYVQYGWSGNGGYPGTVGTYLWNCYNTPEMVEYLFGLGQLRSLWSPGSERSSRMFRTEPTGEPHWVGTSELDIYSKIAFIDHAYLYDSDAVWYYIAPLVVCTKIPLDVVLQHTRQSGTLDSEFGLHMERLTFETVQQWYGRDKQFQEYADKMGYDDKRISELGVMLSKVEDSLFDYSNRSLLNSLRQLYRYFYPWAVAKVDESREHVERIVLRPQKAFHLETRNWSF